MPAITHENPCPALITLTNVPSTVLSMAPVRTLPMCWAVRSTPYQRTALWRFLSHNMSIELFRANLMQRILYPILNKMIPALLLVLFFARSTELLAQTNNAQEKTSKTADQKITYCLHPDSNLPGAKEFQRGWKLEKGIGEKIDHNRACAAFRDAMVMGHPLALNAYGFLLFKADVKGSDPFLAEQICKASAPGVEELANQGDPTAMALFGRLILHDFHPNKWITEKPSYYYKKAAEKNDPYGQMLFAHLYLDSKSDVGKNIPVAISWYQKAVSQDYSEAYHSLAMAMREINDDRQKVVSLLRTAADRDVVQSQIQLAQWYREGNAGLKTDYKEAWKLTMRSAELGDYDAMKAMARHHESLGEKKSMWEWDEKANNLRKSMLKYGKALADRDRKFDLKQYLAEQRESIARENANASRRAKPNGSNDK